MLLDNAVANGKSEPGAAAIMLGGKKRIKNYLFEFLAHAHPLVTNHHDDLIILLVVGGEQVNAGISLLDRMQGVHGQIDHHLLQLLETASDGWQGLGQDVKQHPKTSLPVLRVTRHLI